MDAACLVEQDVAILEGVGNNGGALANDCTCPNLQELVVHDIQRVNEGSLLNVSTLQHETSAQAPCS